jgi:hypothetical protein
MCRGNCLAVWQRQAVEHLLAMPGVSLALLIVETPSEQPVVRRRPAFRQLLWAGYRRMLRRPAATRQLSITDWLHRVPAIRCAPQSGPNGVPQLHEQDVAAVAGYELDFVLHFAFQGVRGSILDTPRYGVWSFCHTAEAQRSTAPAGFWEIYHQQPVIEAALLRLGSGPAAVLKKGYFRTKFHSYQGTVDMVRGESAHWPAMLCQQLRLAASQPPAAATPAVAVPLEPASWQVLMFGGKIVFNNLQRLYIALFRQAEFWNIGVIEQPIQAFLQPQLLRGVAISTAPLRSRHVFYADCFGREENGKTQIYFEHYDYRTGLGTIARLGYPWQAGEQPQPVFDLPYHLSYPYLFGSYCIPESAAAAQVVQYDLCEPTPLSRAQPLLPGVPGIDSTLFEHAGRFWLFYTRLDRNPNLNLFIAYSDQQAGPWHEHPLNPVLTDVRCARPAGTPFHHEGRLYRPAQNYSRGYGSSLVINEVVELTPTTFVERPAAEFTSLHPEYAAGMHTLSAIGPNRTAVDFKRHGFSTSALRHSLKRLLLRYA